MPSPISIVVISNVDRASRKDIAKPTYVRRGETGQLNKRPPNRPSSKARPIISEKHLRPGNAKSNGVHQTSLYGPGIPSATCSVWDTPTDYVFGQCERYPQHLHWLISLFVCLKLCMIAEVQRPRHSNKTYYSWLCAYAI
jgi:hypothetical protein